MRVRRLLFLLLLVAIPLQGIAAATRMICADVHGTGTVDAHSHGHPAAASGDGHAGHGSDAGFDAGNHPGAESCAHCAACTVGAALIDSVPSPGALAPTDAAFMAAQATAQPRPFDGPERPPRTI